MKTKLILLTAVLAVTAAQAANQAPLWAGDHPGSFMRRQTDPAHAYTALTEREKSQGYLSDAGRAELAKDKAEYNAYIDWARKQSKK